MATYYKQENGQFHFHDDLVQMKDGQPAVDKDGQHVREENLVHSSERIGIAYCQLEDSMHAFTHGTEEGMQQWVEAHNAHSPHKAQLKILDQNTSTDVINKAIVDPAFFATLL